MSSQMALELSPKIKIIDFVDLVKPLILYFDFKLGLTKLVSLSSSFKLDNVAVTVMCITHKEYFISFFKFKIYFCAHNFIF